MAKVLGRSSASRQEPQKAAGLSYEGNGGNGVARRMELSGMLFSRI